MPNNKHFAFSLIIAFMLNTPSYGETVENNRSSFTPETASGDSQTLGKVVVEADAERDPYDPVDTTKPYNKSYAASNARTATKTDTPLMETPVSVQVVPRAVMDDQQVISVGDALKNVSGAQPAGYTFYDSFILRGFDATSSTFRNGLRYSQITSLETANLERIEILKGPSAVLFGRGEPGGLVNLTTKRPLEEAYYSIQQQFGSYDLFRTTIDATGPVLSDRSLLYRMNLAYKDNNSFQDFVTQQSVFVAPSLTWRPNDRFEGNLDIEYQHNEFTDVSDVAIPSIGNRPAPIPLTRLLGDPAAKNVQDRVLVGLDWTYKFNDDWKLTNRFQYNDNQYNQRTLYSLGLDENNPSLLNRGLWHANLNRTTFAANLDLTGHFKTGILEHDVLVGFDYLRFDSDYSAFIADESPLVPAIDIFNPSYGIDLSSITSRDYNLFGLNPEQWYGVYFQDQITLWDKVHILGGGRHDWAAIGEGFSETSLNSAGVSYDRTEFFSPRVGIVYQPWPWLSLYGNYVESIGSNNAANFGGAFLPPQTAQQWEVGLKTEWFDGKLNSTLAFFDLTKQSVETKLTGQPFSRAIGEANSQGVEFDIAGRLTENLSIIGSYAYTDAGITKDLSGTEGNRLASVPRNSGSLWAKWEFGDEFIRGLSLGTGIYVRGTRSADNNITSPADYVQLPGYARWDAGIGYSFKQAGSKITTQLNVYNILDKDYYDRANTSLTIQPGAPLTFLGSVRVEF